MDAWQGAETERSQARVAGVMILRRARALGEPLDYEIPETLPGTLREGMFVRVPLGRSQSLGVLVELKEDSPYPNLKPLIEVIERGPALSPHAVALSRRMARYYLSQPAACLSLFLPPGFDVRLVKVIRLVGDAPDRPAAQFLLSHGGAVVWPVFERAFGSRAPALLEELVASGVARVYYEIPRPRVQAKTTYDILVADSAALESAEQKTRSPRLKAVLEIVGAQGRVSFEELKEEFGVTLAHLKKLAETGAIHLEPRRLSRVRPQGLSRTEGAVILNAHQARAVEAISRAIEEGRGERFLLHGVTGSGKTEVYLRAAQRAVEQGKGVLYLVPEISLTPQTVARVERVFGERVAVFHSSMRVTERLDEWLSVREGHKNVVVGARSALFAPLSSIGLIVVDEEHEPAYKQDKDPHYDARTVAGWLGELSGAPVVYGTATPSIERMYAAERGDITLLELPERISGHEPAIEIVDMKRERSALSTRLRDELEARVKRGEKSLLFLNRRGYAVVLACADCGHVAECPNCAVSLRYHADEKKLVCHYCGHHEPLQATCAACGSANVRLRGTGTQKLEEELKRHAGAGDAEVVRLDSDVTRKGKAREELIRFIDAESGVMVGTQMISKGLHFPDVTLIGVVNADVSLHMPDFRAEERTFQLLLQVIGRTARGEKPGKVIIQTWNPSRDVIRLAAAGDYKGFYRKELEIRKAFGYPPFVRIVRVVCSSENEARARATCEEIRKALAKARSGVVVLGPMPCPIAKLRKAFRFQLIIKHTEEELPTEVRGVLAAVLERRTPGLSVRVDVDPVSML